MNRNVNHTRSARDGWARLILFTLCALHAGSLYAGGTTLLGEAKASYGKKRAAIEQKYLVEQAASISNQYARRLSEQAQAARSAGNESAALAAQKELERFQASGTVREEDVVDGTGWIGATQKRFIQITESNDHQMRMEQAALGRSYIQHLEQLKESLTQKYLADQALLVEEEIATVKASIDFGILPAAAPDPVVPPAGEIRLIPHVPAAPPAVACNPVAPDRLVVIARDPKGPVPGVKVEVISHTSDKSHSQRTDRQGRAEFIVRPDQEYAILILNTQFEPYIHSHCIGGESYEAELVSLPEGVNMIEAQWVGDFKLPGISSIRFSGSYGLAGGQGSNLVGSTTGVVMTPSSTKTEFSGVAPLQDSIQLDLDTWMTVTEKSQSVEMKVVVPEEHTRLILYRKLSPLDLERRAQRPAPNSPVGAPAAAAPAAAPPPPEKQLVVVATDQKGPIPKLRVECKPNSNGNALSMLTDQDGKAVFSVLQELEYVVCIVAPQYEPYIQTHCIGGETYSAALAEMPQDVHLLEMGCAGDFKLPGISSLHIFGSSGNSGKTERILMRTSSPRTTFSEGGADPERIQVPVDTWIAITERSGRVDMKILAPDANTRIILYRELL